MTITLRMNGVCSGRPNETNEIKLVFMKAEEEEFCKFSEQPFSKETVKTELEFYKVFRRNLNLKRIKIKGSPNDLEKFHIFNPNKISPQIRKFLKKHPYRLNDS